jgi:hypothetical protein
VGAVISVRAAVDPSPPDGSSRDAGGSPPHSGPRDSRLLQLETASVLGCLVHALYALTHFKLGRSTQCPRGGCRRLRQSVRRPPATSPHQWWGRLADSAFRSKIGGEELLDHIAFVARIPLLSHVGGALLRLER